jgi:DNA-binding transcriptional regulator YiaG
MAGRHKFSELIDQMPPERRQRSDAQVKRLMTEMLLAELREHSGMTHAEVAGVLGISEPDLSNMEVQTDMPISALRRLLGAVGGTLELIAHLPGGDIRLTQFTTE